MYILHFQRLLLLELLVVRHDACNALACKLIGLRSTTTILAFLAATLDLGRLLQNALPARFSLSMKKISVLGEILINSKFGAANANALENIHDHGVKLNIIDRTSKTIMPEVTRAVMICLTTRAACLSILQDTHTWVKESSDFGLRSFID
jgi:hypothetical protein